MKTTLRPLRSPRRGLAGLPEHERRRFAVDVGGLKIAKIWIWVGVPRGSGLRLLTVPPRRHVTNRGNGLGLQRTWKNCVKIVKTIVNLKHSCQTLKIVGKIKQKAFLSKTLQNHVKLTGKIIKIYILQKNHFFESILFFISRKSPATPDTYPSGILKSSSDNFSSWFFQWKSWKVTRAETVGSTWKIRQFETFIFVKQSQIDGKNQAKINSSIWCIYKKSRQIDRKFQFF